MDSLYIIGFPSLYGGAGAELYHQIKVWRHMCVDIHLIPTQKKRAPCRALSGNGWAGRHGT